MSVEPKQVRVVGFIQDEHETPDFAKFPLPEGYLSNSNFLPDDVREDMMKKENSWCDEKGNVHFSPRYNPDPFIGTDGEVYLNLGDRTMKNASKYFKLMEKGMELLKEVENG